MRRVFGLRAVVVISIFVALAGYFTARTERGIPLAAAEKSSDIAVDPDVALAQGKREEVPTSRMTNAEYLKKQWGLSDEKLAELAAQFPTILSSNFEKMRLLPWVIAKEDIWREFSFSEKEIEFQVDSYASWEKTPYYLQEMFGVSPINLTGEQFANVKAIADRYEPFVRERAEAFAFAQNTALGQAWARRDFRRAPIAMITPPDPDFRQVFCQGSVSSRSGWVATVALHRDDYPLAATYHDVLRATISTRDEEIEAYLKSIGVRVRR